MLQPARTESPPRADPEGPEHVDHEAGEPAVPPQADRPYIAGSRHSARAAGRKAPPQETNKHLVLRVVLATATTLVSVNLWTGGPLLALWVGSRIQSAVGSLSMGAVGATVGVLIVESLLLYRLLAWLSVRYNEVIGRKVPRQQAAWLKPMSGERRAYAVKRPLTAVERIVVVSVVVAVLAFEVWFFFFAHYSLPG